MQQSFTISKFSNSSFLHILCYVFLFSLPFTSSPVLFFLPNDVKPLAIITAPILIFFFVSLQKTIPNNIIENKFLLLFLLYSVVVTIIHISFNSDLDYKNLPLGGFAFRAVITVFIGITVFFASKIAIRVLGIFSFLRLTLVAYSLSLGYASFQYFFSKVPSLFFIIDFVNQLVANSNTEWWYRVHGFASEASLLGSQIYLIVLPTLILSSHFRLNIVSRKTSYFLYFLIFICLIGSGSRWGAFVVFATILLASFSERNYLKKFSRVAFAIGIVFALSLFALGNSLYFQNTLSEIRVESIVDFAQSISVHTRLAAVVGAFDTFIQNPVFGVGLGMSDYWIGLNLPNWSLGEPEVMLWLDPDKINFRPNPKNMFLRLLSELGLLGSFLFFWFFMKEIYAKHFISFIFIFTIFLDFISIDSFAMPTIWVAIAIASCSKKLSSEAQYG